eukprot:scaffold5912_cov91-Phaeocystis_antarctica.AAC.1
MKTTPCAVGNPPPAGHGKGSWNHGECLLPQHCVLDSSPPQSDSCAPGPRPVSFGTRSRGTRSAPHAYERAVVAKSELVLGK